MNQKLQKEILELNKIIIAKDEQILKFKPVLNEKVCLQAKIALMQLQIKENNEFKPSME